MITSRLTAAHPGRFKRSAQRLGESSVPEARKAAAVRAALEGPVSTSCPASVLRTCSHGRLYLDRDSASRLSGREEIAPG